MQKFETGMLIATRGISLKMKSNPQFKKDVDDAFSKYLKADWSEMKYDEDKKQNDEAIKNNDNRIFATYNTCCGQIFIITEWDRSVTTILFPDEY